MHPADGEMTLQSTLKSYFSYSCTLSRAFLSWLNAPLFHALPLQAFLEFPVSFRSLACLLRFYVPPQRNHQVRSKSVLGLVNNKSQHEICNKSSPLLPALRLA